jgi:hypothetical protein
MDILGPLGVFRFRRGRVKRGRADLGETGVCGGDSCQKIVFLSITKRKNMYCAKDRNESTMSASNK